MKVRVDNIIYQLAGSDDPLTADELGKKLAVSSRTIKSEMAEVNVILCYVVWLSGDVSE